jgi:hypothetical protein
MAVAARFIVIRSSAGPTFAVAPAFSGACHK